MNFSVSRRIMVVMTVAAVALGGIALPASAKGNAKARGKQQTVQTVSAKATAKTKARQAEARARRAEAKAARKAGLRYVAVGYVTAVSGDEVQVQVKGGNKVLRRMGNAAFTVADGAKVKLNGERVALDAIAAGDHVMVKGVKLGDVLVARKVIASRPDEDDGEDATEGDDTSGDADDSTSDDSTDDSTDDDSTDDSTDDDSTDDDSTDDSTDDDSSDDSTDDTTAGGDDSAGDGATTP